MGKAPDRYAEIILALSRDHTAAIAAPIGHVAISWNELQANLLRLFTCVNRPLEGEVTIAMWHSQLSDKGQRDMLEAAAIAKAKFNKRVPSKEISHLLDTVGKLSAYRNAAIHATWTKIYREVHGKIQIVEPDTLWGNPKGGKLKTDDPAALLKKINVYTLDLLDYVTHLIGALTGLYGGGEALPSEPERPEFLEPARSQGNNRRKKGAKP